MPAAIAPSVAGSVQPSLPPRMTPYTSAARPTIESTAPARSRRSVHRVARLGHAAPRADERERRSRGRFTRKIEPQ